MKKFSYILSEILDFLGYHFTNRPPTPLASQAMCQRGGCFPQTYNKPSKTYQEQIQLLKSRGLVVADEKEAIEFLKRVNYYRLSAYFAPFQHSKDLDQKDLFKDNTTPIKSMGIPQKWENLAPWSNL